MAGCEETSKNKLHGAVSVRPPVVADFSGIVEISNWATRHTVANFSIDPETEAYWLDLWRDAGDRYPWFVAETGGDVIGFALASAFKGRCAYAFTAEVTVYVATGHQGKGVGDALYGKLIPTLKAQGYRTLIAVIALPNPASERLHAKFGFQQAGVLKHVGWKLGKWRDVCHWQCVLDSREDGPARIKTVEEVSCETNGSEKGTR